MGTDTAVQVRLSLQAIRQGEPLEVHLSGVEVEDGDSFWIEVARVEVEDESVVLGFGRAPTSDGTRWAWTVDTATLEPGLHRLARITQRTADGTKTKKTIVAHPANTDSLFMVWADGAHVNPATRFSEVVQARRALQERGFGRDPSHPRHSVAVFVENCMLSGPMSFGTYVARPFGHLGPEGVGALVATHVAERHGGPAVPRGPRPDFARPVAVVEFPKVFATDADDALALALDTVDLVACILSFNMGNYGTPCAAVVESATDNLPRVYAVGPGFAGNLLGGVLSGEVPRQIRRQVAAGQRDDRLRLLATLYREAAAERRPDFAYFRYWNLLEVIARAGNHVGQPMVDWDGRVVLNRRGRPRLVQDAAEEIVLQHLAKIHHAAGEPTEFGFGDAPLRHVRDLVPIWYRHRNCTAHGGGCAAQDAARCLRGVAKYDACRAALDEIRRRHADMDVYLFALSRKVQFAVQEEFRAAP